MYLCSGWLLLTRHWSFGWRMIKFSSMVLKGEAVTSIHILDSIWMFALCTQFVTLLLLGRCKGQNFLISWFQWLAHASWTFEDELSKRHVPAVGPQASSSSHVMVGKVRIEVKIMGPLLHQCYLFLCRPKKGRKRRKKDDIINNEFLASNCHAQHIWVQLP